MKFNGLSQGWIGALLGIAFLAGALGCNDPADPAGKLSGTVSYKGTPLDDGMVSIVNYETGVRIDTEIQADGTYLATTHKGGLPPGEYKVVVFPPEITDPNPPPNSEPGMVLKEMDNIPKKYRSHQTTPLSVSIGAGENSFDIEMQP
ncbi:carboxypeptidase-like regulatory domain-containing protein [Bremerella sp. T1]|uniref:carboxypeptidase-like regulatory domain-containing protein n=1 Tax=Bremerella sp. TYQ1 TaxID=3119568 RepID=UPI001CCAB4B9|nr:carboxypeptidase-like regulatory domain-containing protein [Bremerella volcania]UBM35964.1 carboxypeptidase-like regulatory domain-containing protein [Bremerella volcania]